MSSQSIYEARLSCPRTRVARSRPWVPTLKVLFSCVAVAGVLSSGITSAQDRVATSSLLSLDQAIQLAIANNRSLQIASLDVDKSRWQVAEFKTKRLPSWNTTVLGSAE